MATPEQITAYFNAQYNDLIAQGKKQVCIDSYNSFVARIDPAEVVDMADFHNGDYNTELMNLWGDYKVHFSD